MDKYEGKTEFIDAQKPPVKAGWICLIIAWAFFLIPVPGLGIIGWALNVAAIIISIIVMVKGRVGAGVVQLVCALVVSPLLYLVGLGILGHMLLPRPRFYRL
jgi:hypothetical protein